MPRAGLSRDAVVRLALDVVDSGGVRGFEDLTLAAVAARAGVAVPSLYKHVASLAELRLAVALECVVGLRDALAAAAVGRSGADAVRAMADAYRDHARRHPGRYAATQVVPAQVTSAREGRTSRVERAPVAGGAVGFGADAGDSAEAVRGGRGDVAAEAVARPAREDGTVEAAEALARGSDDTVAVVAAALRGYGLPPERTVDAVRAIRAALHGFVSLEIAGGFGLPHDIDVSFAFLVDAVDAGIRSHGRAPSRDASGDGAALFADGAATAPARRT